MFFIKLRTAAAAIITLAAMAAGAHASLSKAAGSSTTTQSRSDTCRFGGRTPGAAGQREAAPPKPIRLLKVSPGLMSRLLERQQVIEQLATLSRGNYAKIATWQGSYSYVLRQYLNDQFVAQLQPSQVTPGGSSAGKPEPLMQEFDSVL